MKSMTRLFVLVLLAGMVSFGCGGGGGGGSTDDGGAPVPESTYVLSGTVTVSGGGTLAGVTITLSGASSGTFTTDANGYYSFSNLANGAYTVTPTLVGYIFTPASQAVTVNGADVTGVSFTATESTSPTNTSYTIIDLGTLGGKQSYAAAINNTGMVIGESDNSDGLSLAFLYSDGKMININTISGISTSQALGINDNCQVVGNYSLNGQSHGFVYDGKTMVELNSLINPKSGWYLNCPSGINNQGQIVCYRQNLNNSQLEDFCILNNGQVTPIDPLSGWYLRDLIYQINNNGQIVGNMYPKDSGNYHAFLYSSGLMKDITPSDMEYCFASDINDSGQIVGSNSKGNAFLYNNGVTTDLGIGEAWGINNQGDVVGDFGNDIFLFSNGKRISLGKLIDPSLGWTSLSSTGINDKGQIAGTGLHNGIYRAFIMTPDK